LQLTIANVSPGDYTITISYVGLRPFSPALTVSPGLASRVGAVLQVPGVSEEVTVSAAGPETRHRRSTASGGLTTTRASARELRRDRDRLAFHQRDLCGLGRDRVEKHWILPALFSARDRPRRHNIHPAEGPRW